MKTSLAPMLGAICLSSLGTLGLVALMMSMISKVDDVLVEGPQLQLRFDMNIRVHEKPAVARKRQLPPTPKPRTDGLQTTETVQAENLNSEVFAINPNLLAAPGEGLGLYTSFKQAAAYGVSSGGIAVAPNQDKGMTPLVRVAPMYPIKARRRGVEGRVLLEFDVTSEGLTANARVVHADPAGFFEEASLHAVGKWRYRPRVIDGRAVPVSNILVELVFGLSQPHPPETQGEE